MCVRYTRSEPATSRILLFISHIQTVAVLLYTTEQRDDKGRDRKINETMILGVEQQKKQKRTSVRELRSRAKKEATELRMGRVI